MAYKDILVHLDEGEGNPGRLKAAIDLALAHDARLTGLYVTPPLFYPMYDAVYLPATLIEDQQRGAQAAAEASKAAFESALERAGCAGEWRGAEGSVDRQLIREAGCADLLVMGQTEEHPPPGIDTLVDDYVALGTPCPVLFIPYIGAARPPGRRVLVAWNGGREAARAVAGALPLLAKAERVEVLAIDPEAQGDLATADICRHLARHGVTAVGERLTAAGMAIGDLLLSRAADHGFDLIVMGAYGHTRLREAILGGVTRNLLEHMTVPVLMAH